MGGEILDAGLVVEPGVPRQRAAEPDTRLRLDAQLAQGAPDHGLDLPEDPIPLTALRPGEEGPLEFAAPDSPMVVRKRVEQERAKRGRALLP